MGPQLHGDGVWQDGAPWGHISVGMGLLWDRDPWVPVSVGETPLRWALRASLLTWIHSAPSTRTQGPLRHPPPPLHGTHLPLSGPDPSSGAGLSCREQSPQERAAPGSTAGRFPMELRERPLPPPLRGESGPPAAPRGTSAGDAGTSGSGDGAFRARPPRGPAVLRAVVPVPPAGGHPEAPPPCGPPPSSCH